MVKLLVAVRALLLHAEVLFAGLEPALPVENGIVGTEYQPVFAFRCRESVISKGACRVEIQCKDTIFP